MQFSTPMRAFSWLALAGALGSGWPADAQDPSQLEEVKACLERTLPNRTSIQTVEFVTADSGGEIDRSRAKIFWKRFDDRLIAVLTRFSEPPRRAGMAMLVRQRREAQPETFLYLPELRQVRRVSARNAAGSMFSTDFSYEDFAFLQGVATDENAQPLDDVEVEGRLAYVLESRVAIAEEPAYERILYFIERERCTPLKAEFYEPGGGLRKVLEFANDSVEQFGERFVPMRWIMRDLERKSHTAVTVIQIEPDVEIRDRIFEPAELQRGAR